MKLLRFVLIAVFFLPSPVAFAGPDFSGPCGKTKKRLVFYGYCISESKTQKETMNCLVKYPVKIDKKKENAKTCPVAVKKLNIYGFCVYKNKTQTEITNCLVRELNKANKNPKG